MTTVVVRLYREPVFERGQHSYTSTLRATLSGAVLHAVRHLGIEERVPRAYELGIDATSATSASTMLQQAASAEAGSLSWSHSVAASEFWKLTPSFTLKASRKGHFTNRTGRGRKRNRRLCQKHRSSHRQSNSRRRIVFRRTFYIILFAGTLGNVFETLSFRPVCADKCAR